MGVRVKVGFKDSVGVQIGQNSIAFGSAPRREADSQPISPLARPAVSQKETHSLGFCHWQSRSQVVGRPFTSDQAVAEW